MGGRKSVELCCNTEAETVKQTASREKEEGFCILKCHHDPGNCQPVTCQDFLKHGTERGGEEKKGKRQKANTAGGNIQERKTRKLILNCERTSGPK